MKRILMATACLAGGMMALPAQAAFIDAPVPTNAYITYNGLDWAWASPCSPTGCNGDPTQNPLDLSYQGGLGWRLATPAEIAARPQASDFVFAGANVPLGGTDANGTGFNGAPGDAACAAAYFTNVFYNHCDYGDGSAGAIYGDPNYFNPSEPNVETWVVRSGGNGAVPEPSTWAMLLFGFGALGGLLRRRRQGGLPAIV